jgi:hypothetical protein
MATYVILSRIAASAFDDPKDFEALVKDVSQKIKRMPGSRVERQLCHAGPL